MDEKIEREKLRDFVQNNKDTLLRILHESEETGKEKGIAFCQIDREVSLQGEYTGREWAISSSEIKCVTGNKIGEYHTHPEAEYAPVAQDFSVPDVLNALKDEKKIICVGYRADEDKPKDNIKCLLFNREAKDKAPFKEQKAIDQKALLMHLTNRRHIELLNLMEGKKMPREFIGEFNLLVDAMADLNKDFMALGKQTGYIQKEKIA